MCILGHSRAGVKGRTEKARARGSDASGPRRARKIGQGEQGPAEAPAVGVPKSKVAALLACSWFKSPEGERPVQLERVAIGPTRDRRVLPRIPGLLLTEKERDRARTMLAIALGCRSRVGALRKMTPAAGGAIESRLLVALPCGSRMCEDCDAARRKTEAARVEGHWRLFWTLGIPAGKFNVGDAWRKIGGWVRALFRELRRDLALKMSSRIKVDDDERDRIKALNQEREHGKRKAATLQYAWCLEPHKSGYPHLHFVTNASYIGFEYIKSLWSRIVGETVRWARYERVTDQDGVCRYLSKYISKTSFPPDIVALMYRRRQWASTVPKGPPEEPEWRQERRSEGDYLEHQLREPYRWAGVFGWEVSCTKKDGYALFTRFLTMEQVLEKQGWESLGEEYRAPGWKGSEEDYLTQSSETYFSRLLKSGALAEVVAVADTIVRSCSE